jgi:LacI family transcriptional regulator
MSMGEKRKNRAARSAERPLVLLPTGPDALLQTAVEFAQEWNWDCRAVYLERGELPVDKPIAGALISCLPNAPEARSLIKREIPLVRIGKLPHPEDSIVPAVLPNLEEQGNMAAEHFAERGFKHVAFVGYHADDPRADAHTLYAGLRDRAKDLGMSFHLKNLAHKGEVGSVEYVKRVDTLANWLTDVPKPLGVLSSIDSMSRQILLACEKDGLLVPESVALLSPVNTTVCKLAQVEISAIDPAPNTIFQTAFLKLSRSMEGERVEARTMVSPDGIVERASTNVLATDNPMVARAMRFMWDNLEQDLTVDQIAAEEGIVRSTLERAFKKSLGRSVIAELQRRRLSELCRLLRTTNEPTVELAPQVGFFTMAHLYRCFRRAYGMSPQAYRNRENHIDGAKSGVS